MDHIFFLQFENDVYSAEVTLISHPYHQLYHVLFEDGYENIFFTDPETGNWIEEDLGETRLAAYFGMKVSLLQAINLFPCKPLTWCTAAAGGKSICFGFCTRMEGTATVFEIYRDSRKFLYSLSNRNGEWSASSGYAVIAPAAYSGLLKIIISICKGLSGTV